MYEEEENYFFEDISDEVMEDDTLARLLSFNNVLIRKEFVYEERGFIDDCCRYDSCVFWL